MWWKTKAKDEGSTCLTYFWIQQDSINTYLKERGEKKIYPKNNRDLYKEEIIIPPPHPHERKNINYFPHSKDKYPIERKNINVVMINHGDVDRRTNCWWRRRRWCDEEPCEDIRRFWSASSIKHETTSPRLTIKIDRLMVLSESRLLGWFLHVSLIVIIKGRSSMEVSLIVIIKEVSAWLSLIIKPFSQLLSQPFQFWPWFTGPNRWQDKNLI